MFSEWFRNRNKVKLAGLQGEYNELKRLATCTGTISYGQEDRLVHLSKKIYELKCKLGE